MSTRAQRREQDRQRRHAVVTTGHMPELLQDCDTKLSKWLSSQPYAMVRAREAAAQIGNAKP